MSLNVSLLDWSFLVIFSLNLNRAPCIVIEKLGFYIDMSAVTATHDIPSTMYYYYSHKKKIFRNNHNYSYCSCMYNTNNKVG